MIQTPANGGVFHFKNLIFSILETFLYIPFYNLKDTDYEGYSLYCTIALIQQLFFGPVL